MSRSWTTAGRNRDSSQSTNRFGAPADGWLAPSRILLLVTTTASVAALLAVTSYRAAPDAPQVAGTSIERTDPDPFDRVRTIPVDCADAKVIRVLVNDSRSGEAPRLLTVCGPDAIDR